MAGLMTVPDAARALGVTIKTLRTWISAGELPGASVTIAKRTYLRAAVIQRLLSGSFSPREAAQPADPERKKEAVV